MGNAGGVIRDKNIRTLDDRLNADRSSGNEILAALRGDVDLVKLIGIDREAGNYVARDKIERNWLKAEPGDEKDFFPGVPKEIRKRVLRDAFREALELRLGDGENGQRKIRTIWICLWQDTGSPPFAATILNSVDEITVLLFAFRSDGLKIDREAKHDQMIIVGREQDRHRLFNVGKKNDPTMPEKPLRVPPPK